MRRSKPVDPNGDRRRHIKDIISIRQHRPRLKIGRFWPLGRRSVVRAEQQLHRGLGRASYSLRGQTLSASDTDERKSRRGSPRGRTQSHTEGPEAPYLVTLMNALPRNVETALSSLIDKAALAPLDWTRHDPGKPVPARENGTPLSRTLRDPQGLMTAPSGLLCEIHHTYEELGELTRGQLIDAT